MSVHSYRGARGNTWFVRWPDPDTGRNRSKRGFRVKSEAVAFDELSADEKSSFLAGRLIHSDTTLADVAEKWERDALPKLALKTQAVYTTTYNNWIAPYLESFRITSVATKVEVLERWTEEMEADGAGVETILKARGCLGSILTYGKKKLRLYSRHVLPDVEAPRPVSKRLARAFNPSTVELMRWAMLTNRSRRYDIARQRDALMIRLMAACGPRPGELLALHWEDVDDGLIKFEDAASLGRIKETKTCRGRGVPLPAVAFEELAALRTLVGGRPTDLIFPDKHGEPWSEPDWNNWVKRQWRDAIARVVAGFPAQDTNGLVGSRPYDLRHTAASMMLQADLPLTQVAYYLGHLPSVTEQIYRHLIAQYENKPVISVDHQIQDGIARAAELRAS